MSKKKVKKAKSALENLIQADKLISDGSRWIQFEEARDEFGNEVLATDPKAMTFCSYGAVRHIDGPGEKKALSFLLEAAKIEIVKKQYEVDEMDDPIVSINDKVGHSGVRKMFRRAIKLAREGRRA